jgi:uncharacterized protein YoaH (UPF0181 family)
MSALEVVFYLSGIAAAFGLIPAVMWVGRRLSRANAADTATAIGQAMLPVAADVRDLRDRMTRVEAQFGDNGGGMREAVNNVATDVRVVKTSLGGLTTRFEDHLEQSRDDRGRLAQVEHDMLRNRS